MKKRFLSLIMVGAMTMALTVPAYAATSIGITDSVENVVTDTLNKTTGTDHFVADDNYDGPAGAPTNVWNDGSIVEEVKVTAVKTAEFTPRNVKNINDFDSVGELVKWLEKRNWRNNFYDDVTRDIVDETIKNIQAFN